MTFFSVFFTVFGLQNKERWWCAPQQVKYGVFSDCLEKWAVPKVWWVRVENWRRTKSARIYRELWCYSPSRRCYFVTYAKNNYHSMTLHSIWFVSIYYYSSRRCIVKGLSVFWMIMTVELLPMSLYTHTLRVLPIHFGRETVPSG